MIVLIDLTIHSVPASVNTTRGEHWRVTHRRRKQFKHEIFIGLLASELPAKTFTKIHATAMLTFPAFRRRDEGNFRAELEKALGDVLTERQWIPDDTPEHFTFGTMSFATQRGSIPKTTITLEVTL